MTDEGIIFIEPEESIPDPEPTPDPEPAPAPEPEAPASPVEVITVEDLLDRITGGDQEEPEDDGEEVPSQEGEGTPLPGADGELPIAEGTLEGPFEIIGMDKLLKYTETIQKTADHPLLETPFEDYTVTEGLLLLLLLSVFVSACAKLLKGGFAWLR